MNMVECILSGPCWASAEGKTDELFSTKDSDMCFFVEKILPLMKSVDC